MSLPHVVIDTNVLIASLRSKRGASYRLLSLIDSEIYVPVVSVSLVLEYEAAAMRHIKHIPLTETDIQDIIEYICSIAVHTTVHYLWRPALKDPDDDMILETAVAAGCSHVITFNTRDFAEAKRFSIKVLTPQLFLREIGA